MQLDIKIETPEWKETPPLSVDPKLTYKAVIVRFPNQNFRWLPTYKQLNDIKRALLKCELLNRENLKKLKEVNDNETRNNNIVR